MKFLHISLIALCLYSSGVYAEVHKNIDVGVSVGEEGIQSFHLGMGEYFRVPEKQVHAIHKRKIPHDEIPVVLYIARRARVAPEQVVNLRLGGKSWFDISLGYGLRADDFYISDAVHYGPPYGKALGHYKNRHRSKWKSIRLDDDDVVNLVNLKFISEHSMSSPSEIALLRSQGKGFSVIYDYGNKHKVHHYPQKHPAKKKHKKNKHK